MTQQSLKINGLPTGRNILIMELDQDGTLDKRMNKIEKEQMSRGLMILKVSYIKKLTIEKSKIYGY